MTASTISARTFGGPLDLGVAALSAVSVGFLAFAMPDALFSSLVTASHLPDVIAAAAPPLGMTARYAVMAGAGALAFLLVWSLLRALDGASSARPAKAPGHEFDPDAPRVRRADAHPDAPVRRPIFAGAEFGEPASDIFELDTPEPGYRQPVEAPEPVVAIVRQPSPPATAEPAVAPDVEAQSAEPVASAKLPRFMVPQSPEPEAGRNPVVPATQKKSFDSLSARLPEGPAQGTADSIGSLMHRLERGLVEREEPRQAVAPEPDIPAPLAANAVDPDASLPPEGVRHRLRSAISELNQRAGRG
jgi:hypothetical protein